MGGYEIFMYLVESLFNDYIKIAENLLSNSTTIDSHATLRDYVMGQELLLEIEWLRKREFFYECINLERITKTLIASEGSVVHFHDMPSSVTAQLYVNLFRLLSEPSNLYDLLKRLSPIICIHHQYLKVEFEEAFPPHLTWEAKKRFFRESPPSLRVALTLKGLRSLPPTLEALASCVITDHYVLVVADIHRLSFVRQMMLYDLLRHELPVLARALYNHNPDWQRLAADIEMVKKAGLSPKVAIERLIQGLRRGGAYISRSEAKAQPVADAAVERFLTYFHTLPESIREALLRLPSLPIQRLFNGLDRGDCVEVMASKLQSFLDQHPNEPILNALPGIHPDLLKKIEGQCRRGLDTQKSPDLLPYAPIHLLKGYVQQLRFNNNDELYYFLSSAPPELVRAYFRLHLLDDFDLFALQTEFASSHFFSDEKIGLIIAAVLISPRYFFSSVRDLFIESLTCGSFNRVKAFYHTLRPAEFIDLCGQYNRFALWLISDRERIQWLLSTCLVDTLKAFFSLEVSKSDYTELLYHLCCTNPELFFFVLKSTTPFIRDALLLLPDFRQDKALHSKGDVSHLVLIRAISRLGYDAMESVIRPEQVRALVLQENEHGFNHLYHKGMDMEKYLPCLSKRELFSVLVKSNKCNRSPLGDRFDDLPSVFSLLSGCPFPDGRVYQVAELKDAWPMLLHLSEYLCEDENKYLARRIAKEIYNRVDLDLSILERGLLEWPILPGLSKASDFISNSLFSTPRAAIQTVAINSMRAWLDGFVLDQVTNMADLVELLKRGFERDEHQILRCELMGCIDFDQFIAMPHPESSSTSRMSL